MYEDASIADLRMMFDNTLIRYKDEPVFIHRLYEDKIAECLFIGNQEEKIIHILDKGFNFTPISAGYVNVRGNTVYLRRIPMRKYKQGLSKECIEALIEAGDFDSAAVYDDCRRQVASLKAKCLYNMAKKVYPSLEEAIASFEDKAVSVAFDRQFCVTRNGLLRFKHMHVGVVNLDNAKITFQEDKAYLKHALGNNYEIN